MNARAVMVPDGSSGADKSGETTALCRRCLRGGYRVAPFKAQSINNHLRLASGMRQNYAPEVLDALIRPKEVAAIQS